MSEKAEALARELLALYAGFDDSIRLQREKERAESAAMMNFLTHQTPENRAGREFYPAVERLCLALAAEQIEPDAPLLLDLAGVMLAPPSGQQSRDMTMIACQQYLIPLLGCFRAETLARIRADFLRSYPKRTLFPKQRALLKALDAHIRRETL
ncbi:MAG: hypothetical protein LUH51_01245 [Firmicutes bacterium]|nr:hypothetical protein [Bacillota bacterium]